MNCELAISFVQFCLIKIVFNSTQSNAWYLQGQRPKKKTDDCDCLYVFFLLVDQLKKLTCLHHSHSHVKYILIHEKSDKHRNPITAKHSGFHHGKSNVFDGRFSDARTTTLVGKHGNFVLQFNFARKLPCVSINLSSMRH